MDKEYTINFNGNLMTRLIVVNNEIKILESMDGWGNPIDNKDVIIKQKEI